MVMDPKPLVQAITPGCYRGGRDSGMVWYHLPAHHARDGAACRGR